MVAKQDVLAALAQVKSPEGAPLPETGKLSDVVASDGKVFFSITVDAAASRGLEFQVPAGCQAQWLELSGRSGDIAQQSDVTITDLKLSRTGGGA